MSVRKKTVEETFGVHILRTERGWYEAFTGGWGSGCPVVDVAKATTLECLWKRLAKAMPKVVASIKGQ